MNRAAQPRNTRSEHLCRICNGAGEVTHNDTNPHGYGPDPQCDYGVACDTCAGNGWVRFAPVDPLEVLKQARNNRYKFFPWGAQQYGRIRQEAVSPVVLP